MLLRLLPFCALAMLAAETSASETWLRIEEIRIDQPGIDEDEYFELRGSPGLSLDGMSYVVLGDGAGGCGTLEAIVDLDGLNLDANGLLCVASQRSSLRSDARRVLNFENNDVVTHLLVRGLRAQLGDDLDRDDDGVLDGEGWDEAVDAIVFQEGVTPDCVANEMGYADSKIPPDGHFVAGHAYRCGGEWVVGSFEFGNSDTPGLINDCEGKLRTATTRR